VHVNCPRNVTGGPIKVPISDVDNGLIVQGGPLPVINGAITAVNGLPNG